jgi:hypothetical protein
MAKPRVTATDRLANVLDVVELGRRTGMLSVERTVGIMLEEGEVYFVSGTPIYAVHGPWRGRDALEALSRWNDCRFGFDPQAPQPIPNIAGLLPAVDHSSPSGFGYAYSPAADPQFSSSGIYPGFSDAGRPPFGQPVPPMSPAAGPWSSPASGYPSGGLGGASGGQPAANSAAGGVNGGMAGAGFGSPASSSGGSGPGWGAGSGQLAPNAPPSAAGGTPTMSDPNAQARLQRRPRRAPDVRDLINVVTTYNLSRAHRTVLLLADGEHSIVDLARLSGKPVDEVSSLLRELEGQGLVYYYQ